MSGCAVTYVSFYISVYFIYEIKYILHNNQFFAHTLWHSKHACTIDNKFKLQSENATKKKSSGSWITKCTLLSFKRESTESITHACQHIYYRISLLYVLDCRCFLKGWFICAIAILHCTLFSRLICGDLLFNISISYTMCSEYAVFTLCIHPLTAAVVTVQI